MPPRFIRGLMEIIPLFLHLNLSATGIGVEAHNIRCFPILGEKTHDASHEENHVPPETQILCRPLQITDNGC